MTVGASFFFQKREEKKGNQLNILEGKQMSLFGGSPQSFITLFLQDTVKHPVDIQVFCPNEAPGNTSMTCIRAIIEGMSALGNVS